MFTKQKLFAFLAACAVFLIVDLWMFSALRSSYQKAVLGDKKELVVALARSAPAAAEAAETWLAEARKAYYDIPPQSFATQQEGLCLKCHVSLP